MPFTLDPEIEHVLAAAVAQMAHIQLPRHGDALGLRAFLDPSLLATFSTLPEATDVETSAYEIEAANGPVHLRWYRKRGSNSEAAVAYIHGGGMISGSVTIYDRLVREYASLTGVNFLSIDYRLAPEHRQDGLARDVFAALRWLAQKAADLDVDPSRIAVMGDSGGGGIAAAAAIMARDEGLLLKKQILVYPMLDDRNVDPDPSIAPFAVWTYDNNRTSWSAVLGDRSHDERTSPYLAPARLQDFDGLAPAYIEVGELDIFRDESIDYARKLLAAGVSCELHVHPGAPHSFDGINWKSRVAAVALGDRVRTIVAL